VLLRRIRSSPQDPGLSRMRWPQAARARAPLGVFILSIVAGLLPQWGIGQTTNPAPTPEQLELFRNLPADQQRAILEEIAGADGGPRAEDPLATPRVTAPTELFPRSAEQGPPRIEGGEAVLLAVDVEEGVSDQDLVPLLTNRRDRIRGSNPYYLDAEGRLSLPFLAPIALAGLIQAPRRSGRLATTFSGNRRRPSRRPPIFQCLPTMRSAPATP
jgi:hypothetical protein